MQRLLITGATGYLAANFINHCLENNIYLCNFDQVILLDRSLKISRLLSIPSNFVLLESNLENKNYQVDLIIHAAKYANLKFFEANLNSKIIFFSSAAVYGEQEILPISINALPKPLSDYARDKFAVENFLKIYCKHLILRISNPYGKEFEIMNFHSRLISHLTQEDDPLIFLNADYPKQIVRDFLYIDDFCKKLLEIIDREGVLNLSSGKGFSLEDFALMIAKRFEKKLNFLYRGKFADEITQSILRPYEACLQDS